MLQPVRGTKDYVGQEMKQMRVVMETARHLAELFGFDEIQTPIFEFTEVFHRSLGDTSDVVSKETYSFEDRGGESLTLRPEFTAAIVRAFISGGYMQKLPFRAFYAGPAFRYERPQKGRYRQFHQIGVECLGATNPLQDAEVIALASQLLKQLFGDAFYQEAVTLEINTLGDALSRQEYRSQLLEYFSRYRSDLSEESKIRLEKNPLRILDSKQEQDKKIVADAPLFEKALNEVSRHWFERVTEGLHRLSVPYTISPRLVRGLDYYTHTVFEFTTNRLGAQATMLAGGRYDGLVEQLGGGAIAGVGWAAGVERLMLLKEQTQAAYVSKPSVLLVLNPVSENHYMVALEQAIFFRNHGIRTEIIQHHHISKALKKADALTASHFVTIGDDELASGHYRVKTLATGEVHDNTTPQHIINLLQTSA